MEQGTNKCHRNVFAGLVVVAALSVYVSAVRSVTLIWGMPTDEVCCSGATSASEKGTDARFDTRVAEMRKEVEANYTSLYSKLDEERREKLFVSQVFWEKLVESYSNLLVPTFDRGLPISGSGSSQRTVNIYREIIVKLCKWRAGDLRRWERDGFLPADAPSEASVKRRIEQLEVKYKKSPVSSKIFQDILRRLDERTEKTGSIYMEKRMEFIESMTSAPRAIEYQRLTSMERAGWINRTIEAGYKALIFSRSSGPYR